MRFIELAELLVQNLKKRIVSYFNPLNLNNTLLTLRYKQTYHVKANIIMGLIYFLLLATHYYIMINLRGF